MRFGLFEVENVKVQEGTVTPKHSRLMVPEHMRAVSDAPEKFIERHAWELEGVPHIQPYWDVTLDPARKANRPRLLALLLRLAEMQMVVGVRRKESCVGMLFVAKKTGALKIIIDGRQPNSFHRAPPHATMASVESLAPVAVGLGLARSCGHRQRPPGWLSGPQGQLPPVSELQVGRVVRP